MKAPAAFAKNSEINHTRFSALQLVMGQTPHFPGLAEVNPASSNLESSSKYMKTMKKLDKARVMFRQVECDDKLKKVMGQRINPNVEKSYSIGEFVYFYDDKKKEWKQGTALVRLGKTLYLKYGNFLRRVPIDKVRPDCEGEIKKQEEFIEPDDEEARFESEEIPVKELAAELDLSEENDKLKEENSALKLEMNKLIKVSEVENDKGGQDEVPIEEMIAEEVCDQKDEKKKKKRKAQKEKKEQNTANFPKVGQEISYQEHRLNI